MVANSPGILPKTAVVASRLAYYPFTIPTKLNDSATLTGGALNQMVRDVNNGVKTAYEALQPRGPAKWLLPLFTKIGTATDNSDRIAQRNKAVFWDPFANGTQQIGQAIGGPGAYWFLRKSGVEAPTAQQIRGTLEQKLFDFSVSGGSAAGASGGVDPATVEAAVAEAQNQAAQQAGANQAAEGAGEVSAAEVVAA